MSAKIIAFGGVSNSGKTTLIEKILEKYSNTFSFFAIKHDPKNKAVFDDAKKDSAKFFQAGADVCITSGEKSAIFLHQEQNIYDLCKKFDDKDFILIEGFKMLQCPRICVAREEIFLDEIKNSHAIALDSIKILEGINFQGEVLNLEDIEGIFEWISCHAKTLRELEWKK